MNFLWLDFTQSPICASMPVSDRCVFVYQTETPPLITRTSLAPLKPHAQQLISAKQINKHVQMLTSNTTSSSKSSVIALRHQSPTTTTHAGIVVDKKARPDLTYRRTAQSQPTCAALHFPWCCIGRGVTSKKTQTLSSRAPLAARWRSTRTRVQMKCVVVSGGWTLNGDEGIFQKKKKKENKIIKS